MKYIKKKCQPHLWLLTGTSEGHVFAKSLLKDGWKITVSVVSERASLPYKKLLLENLLVGPLKSEQEIRNIILNARINQNGFYCVIDLTHPFAVKVTPALISACKELDQPYIRYERLIENVSNAFLIKSLSDLANFDIANKSILFAIGIKELQKAVLVALSLGSNVYARVLANPDSLKKTLSTSIPKNNFAVLNPSISRDCDLEKALIRKWSIDGVVCRQSGGETEKLWRDVCLTMGIQLWMLARPPENKNVDTINTYEQLSKRLSSIDI